MSRLIAVSIDCRNEEVRRTLEDLVSRRLHYLIARARGPARSICCCLNWMNFAAAHFERVRQLLSAAPDLEIFMTASRMDPQLLLEAFRVGVKEFLAQPPTNRMSNRLWRFEERFAGKTSDLELQAGK